MGDISPHFSRWEVEVSNKAVELGLDNSASPQQLADARVFAYAVLEPLRCLFDGPILINSWCRQPEVNRVVGGSPTSDHLGATAADIIPSISIPRAWREIVDYIDVLPIDQAILYPKDHYATERIHVGMRLDADPRGQLLVSIGSGNYVAWAKFSGPFRVRYRLGT